MTRHSVFDDRGKKTMHQLATFNTESGKRHETKDRREESKELHQNDPKKKGPSIVTPNELENNRGSHPMFSEPKHKWSWSSKMR